MLKSIIYLGYRERNSFLLYLHYASFNQFAKHAYSCRYFSHNIRICVDVTVSEVSAELSSISLIASYSFGVKRGTRCRERIYTPTHLHLVYSLDTLRQTNIKFRLSWNICFVNLIILVAFSRTQPKYNSQDFDTNKFRSLRFWLSRNTFA